MQVLERSWLAFPGACPPLSADDRPLLCTRGQTVVKRGPQLHHENDEFQTGVTYTLHTLTQWWASGGPGILPGMLDG